ncbi:MAG: hypothetical protein J1E01_07260 [Acetatifactor sp.]|nr:hypothetical protein [Acetatifactor sp.]
MRLCPDALKQVSEGVSGYIDEVEADDSPIIPLKIFHVQDWQRNRSRWFNAPELSLECIRQGKMRLGRYEDKTEQQLNWWYSGIVDYLIEKDMIKKPDCSYEVFVRGCRRLWHFEERNNTGWKRDSRPSVAQDGTKGPGLQESIPGY